MDEQIEAMQAAMQAAVDAKRNADADLRRYRRAIAALMGVSVSDVEVPPPTPMKLTKVGGE